MRLFSAFALSGCMVLAAAGSAKAVTYPAITILVPVSVNAPSSAQNYRGPLQLAVICTDAASSLSINYSLPTFVNLTVANGQATNAQPNVSVSMPAGLQSGQTIKCVLWIYPMVQGSDYSRGTISAPSNKMSTSIVLP